MKRFRRKDKRVTVCERCACEVEIVPDTYSNNSFHLTQVCVSCGKKHPCLPQKFDANKLIPIGKYKDRLSYSQILASDKQYFIWLYKSGKVNRRIKENIEDLFERHADLTELGITEEEAYEFD